MLSSLGRDCGEWDNTENLGRSTWMKHKNKIRKRYNAASRKNPHAKGLALSCLQAVGSHAEGFSAGQKHD